MNLIQLKETLNNGTSIFDMPLRVVYYARVSTDKDEQLNSLDNQIYYYEEFINKNKNWTYAGRYVDEGISGSSTLKRESFLAMIADAKANKFDLIITKEISRFSRSTLDSIKYTQELLSYGVGVYFQSDNINTLLPDSELRLTIMASIAQEEVRKLSERLRFGYKRSIEKGRVLGQNNILGYDKKDGQLTINEDEAKIVRRIFEMYNEGKFGVRRVSQELEREGIINQSIGKAFSADGLKQILQNPKYKGYYCSGKTVSIDYRNNKRIRLPKDQWNVYKDENIPAIVSEEMWDKANALYAERSKKSLENSQAYQSRYTFSGKIICGEHGTTYHRHIYKSKKRGDQEVWNCKLYRQKGKVDGCDSPTLYSSELQTILTDVYKNFYENKDEIIDGLMEIYSSVNDEKDYNVELFKLEKELEKIAHKKDKILELHIDGLIDKAEFAERNGKLNEEVVRIETEIEQLKRDADMAKNSKDNFLQLKKDLDRELSTSEDFQTEMSATLLDKIIVHKIDGSKTNLKLEILLNTGNLFIREHNKSNIILLSEIGISQAQVSRLEKNALSHIKKHI